MTIPKWNASPASIASVEYSYVVTPVSHQRPANLYYTHSWWNLQNGIGQQSVNIFAAPEYSRAGRVLSIAWVFVLWLDTVESE